MFLCYCYSRKKPREIEEISSFLNKTFYQFSALKLLLTCIRRLSYMSYVSKLQVTSLVFQKVDLWVCSVDCIIESHIVVFGRSSLVKTINAFRTISKQKMVMSFTRQQNIINLQVHLEVLMISTLLNTTKKHLIWSLTKSSTIHKCIYMTVS